MFMKATNYHRAYPYQKKKRTTVKKRVIFFILQNVQILEKLTYLRVTSSNKSQILVCGHSYG